jgi:hypothetical protein
VKERIINECVYSKIHCTILDWSWKLLNKHPSKGEIEVALDIVGKVASFNLPQQINLEFQNFL